MFFQIWRLKKLKANTEVVPKIDDFSCVPVSIIVPLFNDDEQYLSLLLENLFNITYPSYEIVLVYDGNNDMFLSHVNKTFNLVKMQHPYRRRLETGLVEAIYEGRKEEVRLTLIHKEKKSMGDALNVGVNLAKYPFVVLLDSFIQIDKDAFSNMAYRLLRSNSIVACRGFIGLQQEKSPFLSNVFYQRRMVMNYSKKVDADEENSLWMIRKEMIFTLNGFQIGETIPDFMARCYEYCWDHEMDSAILFLPILLGYIKNFPSFYHLVLSSSLFFFQLCMIGLSFFFSLMVQFYSPFSGVPLFLSLIFYVLIEWFVTFIIYYEMK
jgi:glycosyltransferase involved in cell wall biosynthesis